MAYGYFWQAFWVYGKLRTSEYIYRLSGSEYAAVVDTTTCLYRLRPESDAVKFVSRIWTELDYTFHKPFAKNVEEKVHSFMEQMAIAIGENDSR